MSQDLTPSEPMPAPPGEGGGWREFPEEIPPELARLAAERARLEQERDQRYASRIRAAEAEHREQLAALHSRHEAERAAIERFADESLRELTEAYTRETEAALAFRKRSEAQLIGSFQEATEGARQARDQARWEAEALYESSERAERERFENLEKSLTTELAELDALDAAALAQRERLRGFGPFPEPAAVRPSGPRPLEEIRALIADAQERWGAIEAMRLPKMADWSGLAGLSAAVLVLLLGPGLWFLGWPTGAGVAVGGTVAAAVLAAVLLRGRARRALREAIPPLDEARLRARGWIAAALAENRRLRQERTEAFRQSRDTEIRGAEERGAARAAGRRGGPNRGTRETGGVHNRAHEGGRSREAPRRGDPNRGTHPAPRPACPVVRAGEPTDRGAASVPPR